MGRPREHDERTRAALLAAAEQIVADGGPAALSVRAVAEAAGTTTRAVYSLFGSKEGLLVESLARGAFDFLFTEIEKLEETDDPVADLIDVGVLVFRRLVREHPALYRIAFQRIVPGLDAGAELTATRQKAWNQLVAKVGQLERAGLLGGKPAPEAAVEFNAMMEGLANAELRGAARYSGCSLRGTRSRPGGAPSRLSCGGSELRKAREAGMRRPLVVDQGRDLVV